MSVAAPVRNLLLLVQPQHAEAYLRTTGWARIDGVPDRYTLWSRLDDQEREVFLPLNQKFHDYPRRMAEAIHTLEDFEERPAESIVQDLLSAPFDIIRIKAEEDDDITGSIPLSGGVGLVQGAVDLFIAAGCAAHEKRAYYPSRKPKRALELLESSRLGQTERGSFIITIYVPVPAMPDNPPEMFDPGVSEPFARRSTRTLLQAVRAAGGAAEDSEVQGVAQPFRLAVRDGVSANLCEALADIFESTYTPQVRLGVRWSFMIPPPPQEPAPAMVEAKQLPRFLEASRFFREAAVPRTTIITGKVTRLERDEQAPGKIAIKAVLGERTRKVRVTLSSEDYHNALDAHDRDLPVIVAGEVVREGNMFTLLRPEGFRVISQLTLE